MLADFFCCDLGWALLSMGVNCGIVFLLVWICGAF